MVSLIIDNRELIKDKIKDLIPEATLENLDLGDYIFKIDEEVFIVIERKTIEDYASSIKDGRNREQKKRLKGHYGNKFILYLIEGKLNKDNNSFKYNKVNSQTIMSSIINTMFRDNLQVFHTSNSNETAFVIKSIYNKLQKQKDSFLKNKSTHSEDLVMCMKKKNKNMDEITVFKSILCCIPKLSLGTATLITNKFNNISLFIKEIEKQEDKIKFLQNLGDKRKISKPICENIIKYFF